MPVRAATGEEPETSKTSTATVHWHAHGLCRHCGMPIRRSAEGLWTHEHSVLCVKDGLFAAEPLAIDMPGVGVVRPGVSPDAPGEDSAGDGAPLVDRGPVAGASLNDNLRASVALRDMEAGEQRERLFSQLIFASRDLAHEQIEPATEFESAFCTECGEDADAQGVIAHVPVCHSGRVLQIIADLLATLNLKPEQKEAANTDEEARAGDGIRPQGLDAPANGLFVCVRCGADGGQGWSLFAQTSHQLSSALRSNQCEVKQGTWWYRYEHSCVIGGAR